MRWKISVILMIIAVFGFAQNPKVNLDKFKEKKKLVSEEVVEETIQIRKPENAVMMSRKRTNLEFYYKINIRERLIKSNKLLY